MKRLLVMPFLASPIVSCSAPNCSDTDVLVFVRNVIDDNLTTNLNRKSNKKHTVKVEQINTVEKTDKRASCRAMLIVNDGKISREKQLIYIVSLNDDGKLSGTVYFPD
jgi:hypothetical protein